MAEVAASIVGLAAFGAQCANGVIELKQLLRSIKDAPRDVTRLLDDIVLLQQILQDLEQRHNAFAFYSPPNAVWEATRRQCEAAADDVQNVCSEILSSIRKKRTKGSLRSVLKKDVVLRDERRLDSIKLDLLLAQSAYSDAKFSAFLQQTSSCGSTPAVQYRQASPLCASSTVFALSAHAVQATSTPSSTTISTAHVPPIETAFASQRDENRYQELLRWEMQTKEYRLRFSWLGMMLKFRIRKAYYDWGLSLTCYNVRPYNAEVFEAVSQGNVEGLRSMMQDHQASINDIDDDGNGLLEVRHLLRIEIWFDITSD